MPAPQGHQAHGELPHLALGSRPSGHRLGPGAAIEEEPGGAVQEQIGHLRIGGMHGEVAEGRIQRQPLGGGCGSTRDDHEGRGHVPTLGTRVAARDAVRAIRAQPAAPRACAERARACGACGRGSDSVAATPGGDSTGELPVRRTDPAESSCRHANVLQICRPADRIRRGRDQTRRRKRSGRHPTGGMGCRPSAADGGGPSEPQESRIRLIGRRTVYVRKGTVQNGSHYRLPSVVGDDGHS